MVSTVVLIVYHILMFKVAMKSHMNGDYFGLLRFSNCSIDVQGGSKFRVAVDGVRSLYLHHVIQDVSIW